MSKKRRNHSPEFKAKVALEALKGIEPIHALAVKYRKRRSELSITHKFTAKSIAEGEIGEAGETAPHDGVAWHGVVGAGQVAAES